MFEVKTSPIHGKLCYVGELTERNTSAEGLLTPLACQKLLKHSTMETPPRKLWILNYIDTLLCVNTGCIASLVDVLRRRLPESVLFRGFDSKMWTVGFFYFTGKTFFVLRLV